VKGLTFSGTTQRGNQRSNLKPYFLDRINAHFGAQSFDFLGDFSFLFAFDFLGLAFSVFFSLSMSGLGSD